MGKEKKQKEIKMQKPILNKLKREREFISPRSEMNSALHRAKHHQHTVHRTELIPQPNDKKILQPSTGE